VTAGAPSAPPPALSDQDIRESLQAMQTDYRLAGRRLLAIIPDQTRTAPVDRFFRLLHEVCGAEAARLDFLIALGTHPFLTEAEKLARVGLSPAEKRRRYPRTRILNHRWDRPSTFHRLGRIDGKTMSELSGGTLREALEISLNRRILEYDRLLVLGPVYPHEIAGFSGMGKYLFPGICGPDFIDASHWLGALQTNLRTIGIRDTPARALIERAARLVPTPVVYLNLVVAAGRLAGLFIGEDRAAWERAVELSSRLNVRYVPRPFHSVLSIPSAHYDDFWTGAKAFYKVEPIVADGGELVVYAPRMKRISRTHDALLRRIGFHVSQYYLAHMEKYRTIRKAVLAYSSVVKGTGDYRGGRESTRVRIVLAAGVPEGLCRELNLDWRDSREVDPGEWEGREREGFGIVRDAGEVLYRVGPAGRKQC
jgi:nickel-dependent lactate racemase